MVWRAGLAGISKPPGSAPGRVAYVYVQAPSSPGFINPIRAWRELRQLGEDGPLLAAPFALLFAIVPVGVLFGLLASRRLVRRVRRRNEPPSRSPTATTPSPCPSPAGTRSAGWRRTSPP